MSQNRHGRPSGPAYTEQIDEYAVTSSDKKSHKLWDYKAAGMTDKF